MGTIGCSVNWGSLADWITAVFASAAFILSVCEYKKHKKRERVNHLTQLSIRFTTESEISSVVKYLEALEDNNEKTMVLPNIHQIEMYMRFFEEICCLVKSKALKRNIVYYMFGHYVLVFADNKEKWPSELGYDKGYWQLFRDFVEMMREARNELYPYKNENNSVNEYKINKTKIKL
jgi:hypothetical protein